MNAGPDVQRAISDWLDEQAPARAPDRILTSTALVIDHTKQRRAWRMPWRLPTMNPAIRVAAIALIAIVAVAAALSIVRLPSSNVGGAASPSPTITPSQSSSVVIPPRPPGIATPAPVFPASPLPDPAGEALPADLIGRTYDANPPDVGGIQRNILTLRAADDPHCAAMFEGRSTCFTYLWTPNYPEHVSDPAARGSARIVDGRLVLSFDIVPNDQACVGLKATYTIASAGSALLGVAPPACTVPGFNEVTLSSE